MKTQFGGASLFYSTKSNTNPKFEARNSKQIPMFQTLFGILVMEI